MDKIEARQLCWGQMKRFGLVDQGWNFIWIQSDVKFGTCNYRDKTIALSETIVALNGVDAVLDTILHEIAHALCPESGHGPEWKKMCIKVGAKPQRCFTDQEVNIPPMPYVGTCPFGHEFQRRKLPNKEVGCGYCNKKFDPKYIITWKKRKE